MVKYYRYLFMILLLVTGCTEPYTPDLQDRTNQKPLIIEGYINADGDSEYKLGYIAPLFQDRDSSYTVVHNARLSIEEENGETFSGSSYTGNSSYTIHHPALRTDSKYRLRIIIGNREYLSEYVPVMTSPEIEKVDWKWILNEGIAFYLDTRSDLQTYYRWDFEETWQFRTPLRSLFLFDGTNVRERRVNEVYPTTCYLSEKSSGIYLHTTESQTENTIEDFNFHLIPVYSEKLGIRYSILVKQYALSPEAFVYWSLVKKNSEAIGDIFGTMPTELAGNISCISHPEEKVVGMVEAGKIATKRIFIDHTNLRIPWSMKYDYYSACANPAGLVRIQEANAFFARRENEHFIPVDEYMLPPSLSVTHYSYAISRCLDCSKRGTEQAPAFW